MITLEEEYSRGDIYECVSLTANKLNINKDTVLNSLEEHYEGITHLITDYEKCLNHPSRHLNGLSGPSEFDFFDNVAGKRILLLGEYHSKERL